jgi:hypothetical protein
MRVDVLVPLQKFDSLVITKAFPELFLLPLLLTSIFRLFVQCNKTTGGVFQSYDIQNKIRFKPSDVWDHYLSAFHSYIYASRLSVFSC